MIANVLSYDAAERRVANVTSPTPDLRPARRHVVFWVQHRKDKHLLPTDSGAIQSVVREPQFPAGYWSRTRKGVRSPPFHRSRYMNFCIGAPGDVTPGAPLGHMEENEFQISKTSHSSFVLRMACTRGNVV